MMLSVTLLTLFTSTTIYTIVNLYSVKQNINILAPSRGSGERICLLLRTSCKCAKVATLTINVWVILPALHIFADLVFQIILGDGIVCWRAYAVWQGNRFVPCASIVLLLATFGTMVQIYPQLDPNADGFGSLYEGLPYGVATVVLSLSTNIYTTTAVALKAWQYRRSLRQYIVTGPIVSQAGKALLLIVESGAIYCAIWVPVVAYQEGMYARNLGDDQCLDDIKCASMYSNSFWYIFGLIFDSALVPLIAIYPTIIIILVALNRSHIENGFMKATESNFHTASPLRQVTVTIDAAVTTQSEQNRSSEMVLAICEQDVAPNEGIEGSGIHTGKDRTLDMIV
ncbi:hypothetical protein V8D89_000920 [Ganoderma adspersum]